MKKESKLLQTPRNTLTRLTPGKRMQPSWCGFLFAIIVLALSNSAPAEIFSGGGYFKNFSIVVDPVTYDSETAVPGQPLLGMVSNRLRLYAGYHPQYPVSVSFAYDISPRIQHTAYFESPPFTYFVDPSNYRFADLDKRIYPSQGDSIENFGLYQNLDRAMVTVKTKHADLIIGRQPIAWGSARVVNPTDVIAPFTFDELDREDRFGVDAFRIRVPIGFMGEFDGGYIFGKDFEFANSAFFLRSKFYTLRTDIALLLLGFRENLLLGLDLSRSVGGASVWFESAWVFVNTFKEGSRSSDEDYFRTSLGIDYSFWSMSYVFIEYHYSEAGATCSDDYLHVFTTIPFTEGSVYLLGQHYLAPGLSLQLNPLTTFTLQALTNVQDPSVFITPTIEYNLAQDVYISAGLFWGVGKSPNLVESPGEPPEIRFQSEFGGADDLYYLSFRFYF